MKYTKFNSYYLHTPPEGVAKEYYSMYLCDNRIYNLTPSDNQPYYLVTASLTGYDSMADIQDDLCRPSKLGFAVTNYKDFYDISAAALDDLDFCFYLSALGLNTGDVFTYNANTYAVPEPESTYNLGNLNLVDNSVMYFNSATGDYDGYPEIGTGWAYTMTYPDPTMSTHFVYQFDVFPENFINTGTFQIAALGAPTETPNPGQYVRRRCRVTFECWQYLSGDLQGKFNYTISIRGKDVNDEGIGLYIDGEPTGTIHNTDGPDIEPPTKKRNEGGDPEKIPDTPPVNIPPLPTSDMTSSGSLRVYTISTAQLKQLIEYLHSHDPAAAVLKWWSNPIQSIISLHYLPYAIKHKGSSEELKILGTPTGLTGFQPAEQFQTIHFGYSKIPAYSDTYLNYAPYTKCSIYLPGIGVRELNIDDVLGKRIWVVYHCDNVTGQFMAFVATSGLTQPESKASVRYTFSGSVAAAFPISQENWGNTYIAAATLAAGALATGVSAGVAAAGAGSGGAAAGAAAGTAAGAAEAGTSGGAVAAGVASGAVNVGNSLSSLAKPTVSRSGMVSGTTSLFSVKKPYLILEVPNHQSFSGFASVKGYPFGQAIKLGSLKGYAVIEACHLTDIPATAGEINEIEALLKGGVVL